VTARAFSSWYNEQTPDRLALNLLKYKQREGWSHKDLLLKAHVGKHAPSEAHRALYSYVVRDGDLSARTVRRTRTIHGQKVEQEKSYEALSAEALPRLVAVAEEVAASSSEDEVCRLIVEHRVPREMLPTRWLNSPAIWEALLHSMPPHAMLRNLGKMSSLGMLDAGSDATRRVVNALGNAERIRAARLHPLTILMAQKQYALGHGDKGKLVWRPTPAVVNALEEAFYLGFAAVTPTGKRWCLALDVSGSMTTGAVGGFTNFSPREAAAAMALTIANVEPHYHTIAFTAKGFGGHRSMHFGYPACVSDFPIQKRMTIQAAADAANLMKMGGTDCALPMVWATQNKLKFDVFVVMTDNETWQGPIHACQALRDYRQAMGIDAKMIVMGLVANAFSIADPNDRGSLDVCGFSADVPLVMNSFVGGNTGASIELEP
jgi:60 kDa SS-A/Ro ribonucleoprotein